MIDFLNRLDNAKIYYTIDHTSDDSILVVVAVPGQRWEVQFMADGDVGVEKFLSNGEIHSEIELEKLFSEFSN
jgi:hypothetical protein